MLMVSIIRYLGGLLDAFKAKSNVDIAEVAHETAPDSMPYARSSMTGANLVTTAAAPLPGLLAMLGLLCAVLSGAVQAFAAHLGASVLVTMRGPPPPTASCRPSARRGSVGRFGSAPQLARILLLALMVGFASAQVCTETCIDASNGICNDGGPGSEFLYCSYGTDCTDCGPRVSPPYPPGMAPPPRPPALPPPPLPPRRPPPPPRTPGRHHTVPRRADRASPAGREEGPRPS